ncbi:Zeatin O-xylosyltransferase [Morus notabilis]|uniref:Zeatin O-xylosyltransferase n=2 Tax=Morus notabilis TaxID=981085 RepID=W9QSK4_9ROSA|nr:Zeatin O-xylosyltransferase [Morus notabilis]
MGLELHPEIPPVEGCLNPEFEAFMAYQTNLLNGKSGHLYNTSRVIESCFIDFILAKETETNEDMKIWAIGPLETVTIFKQIVPNSSGEHKRDCSCLEWLDKQERNSVLYISFGTTTFMEDEQIRELAIGLEKSGVKFLWVLRDADKGNVFDESEARRLQLPQGFEERVKGKGIVVRDWAPQLEILGHSSTGGFMSHCGWNSCFESISLGVPIAAWSMHSDQPMNAVLITDLLKVGVVVREWTKRDELVSSSVIEKVAKRLMKSEEGDEIREKAEELGNELRKAVAEGGVSRMELNSFIAQITR